MTITNLAVLNILPIQLLCDTFLTESFKKRMRVHLLYLSRSNKFSFIEVMQRKSHSHDYAVTENIDYELRSKRKYLKLLKRKKNVQAINK